jgi:hypothetical protein
VVVQEDFQQHGASLLEKLERYISSCDRIIALVGDAYGCEPEETARLAGGARRSYTQWEYLLRQGRTPRRVPAGAQGHFPLHRFTGIPGDAPSVPVRGGEGAATAIHPGSVAKWKGPKPIRPAPRVARPGAARRLQITEARAAGSETAL